MSLKFAVVGGLLSALGTRARADDQAQNLGPVGPHDEPILTIFGRRRSAAEPEKPETGGSMIKREARGATGSSPPRKTSGVE
jgi:hypothetical protein